MTTYRRTKFADVLPAGHGVQGFAPFNVGTPLSETKTMFRPVNAGTMLEIMGYVTAGLAELGVSDDEVAMMIYKWHTWLRRVNSWMKDNEAHYLEIMKRPVSDTVLPKNEYFLASFSSLTGQASNAESAPLGPLMPGDKGTMLNALEKGAEKTAGAGKRVAKALCQFVTDVDKLAMYLAPSSRIPETVKPNILVQTHAQVEPVTDELRTLPATFIKFPMNPVAAPAAYLPGTILERASVTTPATNLATPVSTSSAFTTPPVFTASPPPSSNIVGGIDNVFHNRLFPVLQELSARLLSLPIWARALLVIIMFALIFKPSVSAGTGTGTSTDQGVARELGGGLNLGPISEFALPPIDPFV